ncbi:hypothetical protein FOL47_009496 [Perkinsus chesapeaki]|uniref:Uncharacterized protein n=1 Tax=Perkinsus chesapeaki TaxID=330153 RepID=A0A7J6L7Y8_PERCH|nr:hypothetical protein FOL47_009496 [Perkinsus chesapeaki]
MNGTVQVVMQSERPFKGFLVKTDKNLIFTEAPANGKFYDDCPSSKNRVARAAVTHNDPSPKSTVNATMQCGDVNGTVRLTVLIVFAVSEPYRQLDHEVQCVGSPGPSRSSAKRGLSVGALLAFFALSLASGFVL